MVVIWETSRHEKSGSIERKVPMPKTWEKYNRSVLMLLAAFALIKLLLGVAYAQAPIKTFNLIDAVEKGLQGEVERLIKAGADPNVRDQYGTTPLLEASKKGTTKIVIMLLEKNANPNLADIDGSTPLLEASKQGHFDIVKLLVLKGADVNAKDRNDETPVSYANQNGLNEIKDFLISHGALE